MNAEWIDYYVKLGFDPIPVQPNDKKCYIKRWPDLTLQELWACAETDSNLGIRCGGKKLIAVIDCDEKTIPGTFDRVVDYLEIAGIPPGSYPVVQTASRKGRHIYLRLDQPIHGNSRVLSPEYGAGEFRYGKGSFVVAPPSIVSGVSYELISGDFIELPIVTYDLVKPLLKIASKSTRVNKDADEATPPNLSTVGDQTRSIVVDKKIPRRTFELLHGRGLDKYHSRSEAEQAIIVGLINAGFSDEEIKILFLQYLRAGKFCELYQLNPERAFEWLGTSLCNAHYLSENYQTKDREIAEDCRLWAANRVWTGRTGRMDQLVYNAHTQRAYQAGTIIYNLSSREIAEQLGIIHRTASRANIRLLNYRYIKINQANHLGNAPIYELLAKTDTTDPPNTSDAQVRKWDSFVGHDVFRNRGGLGKTAQHILEVLQGEPKTIKELVVKTSHKNQTIKRGLRKLQKIIDPQTGEIFSLVEEKEGMWFALDFDSQFLDELAKVLGISGAGERQKKSHELDRNIYQERMDSRQKSSPHFF